MPFIEKGIPCSQNRDTCCHDCELHFPDCESLVQHLISTHNDEPQERPYRCSICFRDFRSKQSFLQHLKQKPSHRRDLHLAACKGNSQFVAELMRTEYADETGNSHQRTNSLINEEQIGFTPMHCAAFGGHKDCLNMMLDWEDGDPNVKDPTDGRTPVHIAAWKGNAECLQILLHHGGDAELTDNEGKTALDLATPECREVITGHLDYGKAVLFVSRSVYKYIYRNCTSLVQNILHALLNKVIIFPDAQNSLIRPEKPFRLPLCVLIHF